MHYTSSLCSAEARGPRKTSAELYLALRADPPPSPDRWRGAAEGRTTPRCGRRDIDACGIGHGRRGRPGGRPGGPRGGGRDATGVRRRDRHAEARGVRGRQRASGRGVACRKGRVGRRPMIGPPVVGCWRAFISVAAWRSCSGCSEAARPNSIVRYLPLLVPSVPNLAAVLVQDYYRAGPSPVPIQSAGNPSFSF
jgi:hypothetical protein